MPGPLQPPAAIPTVPVMLGRVRLRDVTQTARFTELDKREAYYRCRQYDGLRYDWDGNFRGYGGEADIAPGWYVPLKRRRPDVRYELPRTIVARFTSLLFGKDRWPEIKVEGDTEAEDFARTLARVSRLQTRMIEARNLGGAEGTAVLSWAFARGKPRVQVHNAKNVTVLDWADPEEMIVGAAIEAYLYKRPVWDGDRVVYRDFYYVRYWDEQVERLYSPIPAEIGNQAGWATRWPAREVVHGWGFAPLYWIQNQPDSSDADGESDFEGLEDDVDALNRLLSATHRGTLANVDPTLVIKSPPSLNDGTVHKGSGRTIWSEGGAEYLELKGEAVRAAKELIAEERAAILEAAQCIILDPHESGAGVVSGEALRLRYAPMLAKCDLMREQYGQAVVRILRDMLIAARMLSTRPPSIDPITGQAVQEGLQLPPRIEKDEPDEEENDEPPAPAEKRKTAPKVRRVPRTPGTSEDVDLNWGTYFPYTWADVEKGINAASKAIGNKPVASLRTAVQMVASMTGVENVDAELQAIEEDAEVALDRSSRAFGGPPGAPGEPPKPGEPPGKQPPGKEPPAPPAKKTNPEE